MVFRATTEPEIFAWLCGEIGIDPDRPFVRLVVDSELHRALKQVFATGKLPVNDLNPKCT
jgi:hypothetical protein